jgi:hypothetical protein
MVPWNGIVAGGSVFHPDRMQGRTSFFPRKVMPPLDHESPAGVPILGSTCQGTAYLQLNDKVIQEVETKISR